MKNLYSGELTAFRKKLWRMARHQRNQSPLYPLRAPQGLHVWGNPLWEVWMMVATGTAFALVALAVSEWRYDPNAWPLWLGVSVCVLVLLYQISFVERFTLDTLRRRWHYRRGFRWNVREESGGFDELSHFEIHSQRWNMLQRSKLLYGASLEFADGYRFFPAVLGDASLDAVRSKTEVLARACGLPAKENLSA